MGGLQAADRSVVGDMHLADGVKLSLGVLRSLRLPFPVPSYRTFGWEVERSR